MDSTLKIGLAILAALVFSLLAGYLGSRYLPRRATAPAPVAQCTPRRVLGRPVTHERLREAPVGALFRMNVGTHFTAVLRKVSERHAVVLRSVSGSGFEVHLDTLDYCPDARYALLWEPTP